MGVNAAEEVTASAGEVKTDGDEDMGTGGATASAGDHSEARVDDSEAEVGGEVREARMMPDPGMPTAAQRRKHKFTHCPYRSWCPECVQGRGRDIYHTRCREKSRVP